MMRLSQNTIIHSNQKGIVMKKVSIVAFMVLLFIAAGCQKEKSEDHPESRVNKAQLIGNWKLQKTEEEYWHPVSVLIDSDMTPGEPGDSAIFTDKLVKAYSDVNGQPDEEVYDYTWVNDSTVTFDDETFVIRKLTDTELYLHQEDVNTADNSKDVYKVFMVR
jgi:hypothetical protein